MFITSLEIPGSVNGTRDYRAGGFGRSPPLLLSFPSAGGIEWGHGHKLLPLGFNPIGRIRREADYLSRVSHNCLELLLGYCKHAVINSWAQCLEKSGNGNSTMRRASVETSFQPLRSSPRAVKCRLLIITPPVPGSPHVHVK